MTAEPLDVNRLPDRELLVAVAERVGFMREGLDEFKDETRTSLKEIKDEVKADIGRLDRRVATLENEVATARGGVAFGRWLWGAVVGLVGLVGSVIGWIAKSQ